MNTIPRASPWRPAGHRAHDHVRAPAGSDPLGGAAVYVSLQLAAVSTASANIASDLSVLRVAGPGAGYALGPKRETRTRHLRVSVAAVLGDWLLITCAPEAWVGVTADSNLRSIASLTPILGGAGDDHVNVTFATINAS